MDQDSTGNAGKHRDATRGDSTSPANDVDPKEFLKALLNIDADDAEQVRKNSPAGRRPAKGQEGPVRDYGEG
jgi:hypothetical protein